MIFLDEKMSPTGSYSDASAYLSDLSKKMGLRESMFNRFKHDAGGMEICFESEVAWNELSNQMAIAEFKSLQESQYLNEGFWDTIKSWVSKVKAFFIKIWNAIKAWIKNLWQKLTGTTDKDLIRKVQEYASFGENVDAELYFSPNEFEKVANNTVDKSQQMIDRAYAHADKMMQKRYDFKVLDKATDPNGNGKVETEDIRQFMKEAEEECIDVINDLYEKFTNKDTESIELSSNEIVAGLTNYEKQIKKLVQFLEKEDKIVKTGMKAAEKAESDAKKNESNVRKKAAKANSGVQTDPDVVNAQHRVNACVKVTNVCRKIIQLAMKVANGVKSRLDHDHEACRSAAKEFIKTGAKNKKSND